FRRKIPARLAPGAESRGSSETTGRGFPFGRSALWFSPFSPVVPVALLPLRTPARFPAALLGLFAPPRGSPRSAGVGEKKESRPMKSAGTWGQNDGGAQRAAAPNARRTE